MQLSSAQMRRGHIVALLALLALGAPASATGDRSVSAVQKVVQMLEDMAVKAKKDKQAEEVGYAEFSTWCTNQKEVLGKQIKEGEGAISTLSAEIGELKSEVKELGSAISSLQSDVATYDADKKAQLAQREKEHKEFLAEQQDYGESVYALERAIAVLQKQSYDRTALLQVVESKKLPARAQQVVSAFLGMMNDDSAGSSGPDYAAPQANAYEFQSGGVVEMLKQLRDKFREKKAECEKEELNSKHASDMMVQDLTTSSEKAGEDISSKKITMEGKAERTSLLQKELASTTAVKTEDTKMLSDTTTECSEKLESFDEKQQLRTEEIQALEKAIEILSSEDVQSAATKHLGLARLATGVASLLQTSGRGRGASEGVHRRLREFLAAEGQRLHSRKLGLLAEKLQADPFAKVKKLIDDMITRLLEEAHSDAGQEGFCDKELGTSKITREKLTAAIDGLTAEVDSGKASIAMLTQDIARLSKAVAEIDAAVEQAIAMRKAEKEKNTATIKDATDAQKAVGAAVGVLKEFYAKASVATAMLQVNIPTAEWGESRGVKMGTDEWNALANPDFKGVVDLGHKEGMQTFGAQYSGQQDAAGGVLAMLEVIASDFASLKADTESAEALSQKAHEDFMTESKKNKAVKSKKITMNSADKAAAESKLRDDTTDMKYTQDKLLAADRYYEKLKPQCIDPGMTFEERTKARADEIRSLKEALTIISGEDIPTSAL